MLLGGFKFLKGLTFLFFSSQTNYLIPERLRCLTASDAISIVPDTDTVSFQIVSILTTSFFSLRGSMS